MVLIDYPGFNLRMTRHAKARGIPVLYYVAPQVWAWKERRARQLARDADSIAVILPFEEELFRAVGGRATFVGHPLLDTGVNIQPWVFEETRLSTAGKFRAQHLVETVRREGTRL